MDDYNFDDQLKWEVIASSISRKAQHSIELRQLSRLMQSDRELDILPPLIERVIAF